MNITAIIIALFVVGLILFMVNTIQKKYQFSSSELKLYISAGIILCILFVLLKGKSLVFIDDFNHWGTICRSIVENRTLPTADNTLTQFISYPPGAALWVSYVAIIIGENAEDWYLIAQAILVLIIILPFFQFVSDKLKKNTWINHLLFFIAVFCISGILFFSKVTATVYSLCVESLLIAIALSSFVIIYDKGEKKEGREIYVLPLILSMYLVKDSGMLFSMVDILILLILAYKNKKWSLRQLTSASIIALCLLIIFILWQYHVSSTFGSFESPHSLSINGWLSNFQNYDSSELKQIFFGFIRETISKRSIMFVLICIILMVLIWLGRKKEMSFVGKVNKILWFNLALYLTYLAGMLFVYLFSMDKVNASKIGSYGRYVFVPEIYIVGTTLIILFDLINDKQSTVISWTKIPSFQIKHIAVLFVLIIIIVCSALHIRPYAKPQRDAAIREKNLALLSDETYKDLAIYSPETMDTGHVRKYIQSETIYDARTMNVDLLDISNEDDFLAKINKHHYVMICDSDYSIMDWMKEKGINIYAPGVYDISGLIIP